MNKSILNEVKNAFSSALRDAFPKLTVINPSTLPSNPKFGDYQCNAALGLLKTQKDAVEGFKTPFDIATKIKSHLDTEMFSEVSIAKPGFISVRLSPKWLQEQLLLELKGEWKPIKSPSLRCLVDYSSPNIAKEMHVGHMRSTILGEAACRVLEYVGYTVKRINHVGDWGTQFGMLIEYMKDEFPNFQESPPNLTDLTSFYRAAKKRFDADEVFRKRSQLAVPALQSGEPSARAAWSLFCEISRKDFQNVYDRFQVNLIERGESFYNDMIPEVIKEVEKKGFMSVHDGAKCFFVENDNVPLILVKSDKGYGYDTTDLAAVKYRYMVEESDWVLYFTDLGQESHFHKIEKAAKMMGWHRPPQTRFSHVGFGLVQGEDGKKFKTRAGDTVKLTALLDEAVDRALTEIEQRRLNTTNSTSTQDDAESSDIVEVDAPYLPAREAAEAIGYSAIRYFDLKQSRTTNYKFSYDKMLDPKGNTAVYMLYAYARICAIFRKAKIDAKTLNHSALRVVAPQERDLALQMLKLNDVINQVLEDMMLHR